MPAWITARLTLLLTTFVWGSAFAQIYIPPPPPLSLEAAVLNADFVVVGTVSTVTPTHSGNDVILLVESTLKGPRRYTLNVHLEEKMQSGPSWAVQKRRLLVASSAGLTTAFDLSDKKLAVLTEDLKLIRNPETVIEAAKEAIAHGPGQSKVPTTVINVPPDLIKDTMYERPGNGQPELEVPADDHLLTREIANLKSDDMLLRIEAASSLRFFRNPENIARIKGLLADPDWKYGRYSQTNLVQKVYPVRRAAYYTLQNWKLAEGVPRIGEPANDYIVAAELDNRPVSDADLSNLGRYKNLEELYLDNSKLTADQLDLITKLKSLQLLYLSGSNITAAGLRKLSTLPKLRYLDLAETQITDQGLKELLGFKSLKIVDLGRQVTPQGIAAIGKQRSGLLLRPDEFAFLAQLNPRRFTNTRQSDRQGSGEVGMRHVTLVFSKQTAPKVGPLCRKELPQGRWVMMNWDAKQHKDWGDSYLREGPKQLQRYPYAVSDRVDVRAIRNYEDSTWTDIKLAPGECAVVIEVNLEPRGIREHRWVE